MNIQGLDKARVLKALYNNTKLTAPVAVMTGQTKGDLTAESARKILAEHPSYFDYLYGRMLKVNLGSDDLDLRLYDRDNGEGAGEQAIRKEFQLDPPGQWERIVKDDSW